MNSLRDQLVKAGLVTKEKAAEVEAAKQRQKEQELKERQLRDAQKIEAARKVENLLLMVKDLGKR